MTSPWSLYLGVTIGGLLHHITILPSLVSTDAGGDIHFICHVTPQYHPFEVPYIFMGESCSQQITALENLVAIDILIFERKNASSKHECYKYLLPLKNLIDWVTTRSQPKKCTFWKSVQNENKTFLPLMTIETSWTKKVV